MKIKNFFIFIAVNILNAIFTCIVVLGLLFLGTKCIEIGFNILITFLFLLFLVFLLFVLKFRILSLIYKFMKKDNFFKLFLKDIKENIMTKILYIGISFVLDVATFLQLFYPTLHSSSHNIFEIIRFILCFYFFSFGSLTALWLII